MNPLTIVGLLAGAGALYYLASKSGAASSQQAATSYQNMYGTASAQAAASYGMSAAQLADAQSIGLDPGSYMQTLNSLGLPPGTVLSQASGPPTATSAGFYDPMSGSAYGW